MTAIPLRISSRIGIENTPDLQTNDLAVRGIAIDQWRIDGDGNAFYRPVGSVPPNERAVLSLNAEGMPVLAGRPAELDAVRYERGVDGRLHVSLPSIAPSARAYALQALPAAGNPAAVRGSDGTRMPTRLRHATGRLQDIPASTPVPARHYTRSSPPPRQPEPRRYPQHPPATSDPVALVGSDGSGATAPERQPDGHLHATTPPKPLSARVYTSPTLSGPVVASRGYQRLGDGRMHAQTPARALPARMYRHAQPNSTPEPPVRDYPRQADGRLMPHTPIHARKEKP